MAGIKDATDGSHANPETRRAPAFEEATRDALTGLTNRDMLAAIAERELVRARRKGDPLSLVALDIDCFGRLTSRLGDAAAERLLKRLAQLLVGNTGAVDLPARIGVESFTVLLPETPAQGALVVAERVRSKIETLDVAEIDPSIDRLTGTLARISHMSEGLG